MNAHLSSHRWETVTEKEEPGGLEDATAEGEEDRECAEGQHRSAEERAVGWGCGG